VWIYGVVRNKLRPKTQYLHDELQEEHLTPDESREIEAPAGSSDEMEQLWEGTLDPFEFLVRHRGGKLQEIDYQIFIRISQGLTSAQIGAELGLAASTVRDRVQACRRRFFSK
jgi:DNA-binding NarL/FixJ family response regulator